MFSLYIRSSPGLSRYRERPVGSARRKRIRSNAPARELLVPVARDGTIAFENEPLNVVRERAQSELAKVHAGIRRFVNPHEYPVGLEPKLHELRNRMIAEVRERLGLK